MDPHPYLAQPLLSYHDLPYTDEDCGMRIGFGLHELWYSHIQTPGAISQPLFLAWLS